MKVINAKLFKNGDKMRGKRVELKGEGDDAGFESCLRQRQAKIA